jgi:hypothetical protein
MDGDPHSVAGEQCHNALACQQNSGNEYFTIGIRTNSTVIRTNSSLSKSLRPLTVRYKGAKLVFVQISSMTSAQCLFVLDHLPIER